VTGTLAWLSGARTGVNRSADQLNFPRLTGRRLVGGRGPRALERVSPGWRFLSTKGRSSGLVRVGEKVIPEGGGLGCELVLIAIVETRHKALAALWVELTETATRYPGTDLTIAHSIKGHPATA
jgi:hypothetical protein